MGIAIVICPITIGYNVNINILTPLIVPQDKFFGYFAQIEPSIKFFCHNYKFLLIYFSATWRAQFLTFITSPSMVTDSPHRKHFATSLSGLNAITFFSPQNGQVSITRFLPLWWAGRRLFTNSIILSFLYIVGVNPFDEILAVNLISGKVGFCTCEVEFFEVLPV